jgi:molybdate transport system ATP-binding protein
MSGLDARLIVRRPSGFVLDASFTAKPGTTVALLGPNGAGKSTAVWALTGVIPLDEGSLYLAGRTIDDPTAGIFVPPEDRRIGAVFQDALLFPHLSVADNVAFASRRSAGSAREAADIARDWLDRLGIGDLATVRPNSLSGGQAQRVALARALASGPDLLLLDEPLSALDIATRARVRRVLREHLDSFEGPRVLITHDPAEAALLADQVVVMEDGAITQTGTPDQILRAPRTPYAADLAGLNLLTGTAADGVASLGGGLSIRIADTSTTGAVLLTIHPRIVSLHPARPDGSPRNTWPSVVSSVETLGDLARVHFDRPIPITAEITADSCRALGLGPGQETWIAIKATEIGVLPG